MFSGATQFVLIVIFNQWCSANNVSDQFYPYYHLAPPYGWMNDPNGFCIFDKEYHLFYQHNPVTSQEPGIAHWGHAKSLDLFHWTPLEIAMYPDKKYDKNGVFSGSAIIVNEIMYLLYTGNVNHPGEIPDHMNRQALAYSYDGVHVTKYPQNPVIYGEEYQPNFRDPKVWQHGDNFYMVLGNSFDNNTRGRVLLFSSKNLISWEMESVIDESNGSLGYMWECPDFFELNGKFVLLFSPQGVEPQGDMYRNLYQTGYIVGDFDYETRVFSALTEFRELDNGHDFYATQSILDALNRRIVVAWFDMWEQVYPERNDGWTGQITIPRVLELTSDLRIIQKPVTEIKTIRGDLLYSGYASNDTSIKVNNNAGEIKIRAPKNKDFELILEAENATVTIKYDHINGKVSLDRGGNDGIRRTDWSPNDEIKIQIFIDRSSIELFCGCGEVTFSSRFFPNSEVTVKLGENSEANDMRVYCLRRTVPAP